jgi:exodeoxyribonuclease VII small subunit
MEKKKAKAKITFESALKELEKIAGHLEEGSLDLDDSITEYERGMRLAKFCHNKLEEAEKRIEILQKGDDGEIRSKKVKLNEDSGELDDDEELQGTLL